MASAERTVNFGKSTPTTPDRTAALRGAIRRRPKTSTQPTPVPESTPVTEAAAVPVVEDTVPEQAAAAPQAAAAALDEVTKAVAFWVRTEVKTWIADTAKERHLNNAEMIQQAIEDAYETLAAKAPSETSKRRQLFTKAPKNSPRRRDGAIRGQLFARFTHTNLEIIDSLVDELGLGNRSILVEDAVLTMINSKEN